MLDGWNYVELRGTFWDVNGPARGTVEFSPTDAFEPTDFSYRVTPVPFRVRLDGTGSFAQQLIATDNPTGRGNDWLWRVVVRAETINMTRYLRLPAAVPVMNFSIVEEDS